MKCGLLGRTLGHSYSPQIHSYLGDYPYALFERELEDISAFLRKGDFTAINVTIPYKKDVMPYCAELTDCARKMGAVNTIVRRKDGSLIGHNTDYFGLHYTFNRMGLSLSGKKVLVLGSGGASVTTVIVLKELGANVVIISRSGENNYTNLHLHKDARLIVNTTPVGMYPNTGISPVDLTNRNSFPCLQAVVDVIYNPARTKLLLDSETNEHIECANGLLMLAAQAKEAAEWFTGRKIPNEIIGNITRTLEVQMQNIVLVGMPGCGKTTIGKLLAESTGRRFVDTDTEIIKRAGKSIPDIFAQDGEEAFRDLETEIIETFGRESGLIIATGGGCVTKARNYNLLHQNGTIFWIQRKTSVLPVQGRPLSQTADLEEMFRIRQPLYEHFSDWIVENNANPGAVAEQIQHILEV